MYTFSDFVPTRIIFGCGSIEELRTAELPGKKAVIVTTGSARDEFQALLAKVEQILDEKGIAYSVYTGIAANPTKEMVEGIVAMANELGADFFIGLGGGSCIDASKAAAMLYVQGGDLWDYAYTGTGGQKDIAKAAPIVAITTTSGTGTESDPYSVITKTETGEKLDFASEPLFPTLSVIDPELMVTLPYDLTVYQGIDALFHAAECLITNRREDYFVDLYGVESVQTVFKWLPVVAKDPENIEGRERLALAADILSGFTQALSGTTSHHILAQTIGGFFPNVAHGATLILVAEAYYARAAEKAPHCMDYVDECVQAVCGKTFREGLAYLFDTLGVRDLAMSDFGIKKEDLPRIADATVNRTGVDDVDVCYQMTEQDMLDILEASYR